MTPFVLQPGESAEITVSFDPGTIPGYFDSTLTVVADTEAGSLAVPVAGVCYIHDVPVEEVTDFGLGQMETRIVEELGPNGLEKWFEVGFGIDAPLTGNAADGWSGAGDLVQLKIERSENLQDWYYGEMIDCVGSPIANPDGTYDYWARSIFPQDSQLKTGTIRSMNRGGDARMNPFLSVSIAGVIQDLPNYPYSMPDDAELLAGDLESIGWIGATCESSGAGRWDIMIPGVFYDEYSLPTYVQWPMFLVPDSRGDVVNECEFGPFTGEFVNAANVRTALTKQFCRLTPFAPERLALSSLASSMATAVDALLDDEPAISRAIFSNVVPPWDSMDFWPNPDFFAPSISGQLTGISMRNGAWHQSYGPQMLTPRHAILCGHNGPDPATSLWFVKEDGSDVFQTTILNRINDAPGRFSSDTQQTYEADLSIVLLADEVPGWVYKAGILPITAANDAALVAFNPPTLAISQGNSTPEAFPDDPGSWTPNGRMLYVSAPNPSATFTDLREPFARRPKVTGDSGTPEFILWRNRLWLYRIINDGTGGGANVAQHLNYINRLIARADAAAGIATGYRLEIANVKFS